MVSILLLLLISRKLGWAFCKMLNIRSCLVDMDITCTVGQVKIDLQQQPFQQEAIAYLCCKRFMSSLDADTDGRNSDVSPNCKVQSVL